jgi:hypothetical protein
LRVAGTPSKPARPAAAPHTLQVLYLRQREACCRCNSHGLLADCTHTATRSATRPKRSKGGNQIIHGSSGNRVRRLLKG